MPSSVTHFYFSKDVYNKCNKDVKNKLLDAMNFFSIFAQGPDPYFFYNFHLTKKSKDVFKINRSMQHSNVNSHFIKLINYINKNGYYSNSQVIAYLYGQICHFVLDSTIHPYIIYYTGIYNNKIPNSYKYNGLHEEMEYYIDCHLIYEREKISPRKYKAYKNLFCIDKFNNELNTTINDVVKDVYNFENVSDIYYKSIIDMKKFYYIFNYDRFGIKKGVYSIMDFICGNKFIKKKVLSFFVNPNSKNYYLNLDNVTWNHPCDINEKYSLSFYDLYMIAINKAIHIIDEVDKMLKNKCIDEKYLRKLFGNLHYGTGKDCNLEINYMFFRF